MIFGKTRVAGAFAIDLERRTDERGFFARSWCQREFEAAGLDYSLVQINVSYNVRRGTLRGMHFQLNPHEEAKVVSCMQGAICDVVLDLRPKSPTYLAWAAEELTAENRRAFYIPKGCAHGFQTLKDDTQVLYLMSEYYSPGHGKGVRYDDPVFGIKWPLEVTSISEADRSWLAYQVMDETAAVGKLT